MLIVPLDEAREGMKLAAPVMHPENPRQQLLRAGFVLDGPIIRRMADMGIEFLYAEYPALESLDRHLAVYLSPARQAIYQEIKDSMAQVQRQTRASICYEDYCTTTRDLVQTLLTQGQNPIYLDQMSRQGGDAVAHAAAVAHLSLLLGLKLEQYLVNQRSRLPANRAKDIVSLGVAGMLHDLGVAKLSPGASGNEANPPEADEARAEWETHPRVGYELIRNDVPATAAAAVYQHHQHFDGSGFPIMKSDEVDRGAMAGQQIHVFARIIFCANLFDRLTSPGPKCPRRGNREALRLIKTTYAGWCDPEIVRVLESVAPPYPPGCRVRLSDGSRAVVTDVNPTRPAQPIVRRLAEDNWTPLGEPMDLSAANSVRIADEAEALAAC